MDRFAVAVGDPRPPRDDPRRGAAFAAYVCARAALDGHTVTDPDVVRRAVAGLGFPDPAAAVSGALEDGRVLAHPEGLSLARYGAAEAAVAAGVTRLLATGSVTLEASGQHTSRPAGLVVVDEAEQLDVLQAAALLSGYPDGTHLLLVGDPAQLPPPGPGRVFADLMDCGALPTSTLPTSTPDPPPDAPSEPGGPLQRLVAAVRRGELPPPPPRTERPEVAVLSCPDGDAAARATVRLVTEAIPRALGIPAAEIQVLTPMRRGPAGTAALDRALEASGAPAARTVHGARGARWPAVVCVLPPDAAGLLSRPLVYTAFTRAERHLSVVHACGPALARAVRAVGARPRRTRLARLLAPAAGAQ